MARKTRAAGGGRKPLDPHGSDVVQVRIPNDTRRAIDHLAKEHGRDRSNEIRRALKHWIRRHQIHGLHIEALASAIALLAENIERVTGKPWIEDAETGLALREQAERLIFHFAPTPAKSAKVPPQADVVGFLISMIENIASRPKDAPPITFPDNPGLSELLRALARKPPDGLGSGWRRNREVWEGKAKS